MNNLYIIGNGFDIYHGLDTKYSSFGGYLKKYHSIIYDYLIEYYGFSDVNAEYKSKGADVLWSEFEETLALLDSETVLEAFSDSLARPGSSEFRDRDWGTFSIDIELIIKELTDNLFEAFKKFILNVKYPELLNSKRLPLIKEALYLTFNYTDTLERYYEVNEKNILYIHGKAELDDNDLILGHGVNPDNFEIEDDKPPDGLSSEEYEQWSDQMTDNYDHSYELGKQEMLGYFLKTFKETKSIIHENESFFENLNEITNVVILGHSLSDVDMPYFKKVFDSISKNSQWSASYYCECEKHSHMNVMNDLGIKKRNRRLISIEQGVRATKNQR